MTVTYNPQVATASNSAFLRLLLRWRGSVYKLVYMDLVFFCVAYAAMSLVYHYLLTHDMQTFRTTTYKTMVPQGHFIGNTLMWFQNFCKRVDSMNMHTSITFLLGFYTTFVMNRWWEAFRTIPLLYTPSMMMRAMINHGDPAEALSCRVRILRYFVLAWIFSLRSLSRPILLRFKPTEKLSDATLQQKLAVLNCDPFIQRFFPVLITDDEITSIIELAKAIQPERWEYNWQPEHFVPLGWAADVVHHARRRGLISSDVQAEACVNELTKIRSGLGHLGMMDLFNVPLVYTQVVQIAVYTFVLSLLFARQFVQPNDDYLLVLFTLLKILFYMGWIKRSYMIVCTTHLPDLKPGVVPVHPRLMPAPAVRELGIPEIVELPLPSAAKDSMQASGVSALLNGVMAPAIRVRKDSDRSVTSRFADPDLEARSRQQYDVLVRHYAPGDDETVGSFGGYPGSAIVNEHARERSEMGALRRIASSMLRLPGSMNPGSSRLNIFSGSKARLSLVPPIDPCTSEAIPLTSVAADGQHHYRPNSVSINRSCTSSVTNIAVAGAGAGENKQQHHAPDELLQTPVSETTCGPAEASQQSVIAMAGMQRLAPPGHSGYEMGSLTPRRPRAGSVDMARPGFSLGGRTLGGGGGAGAGGGQHHNARQLSAAESSLAETESVGFGAHLEVAVDDAEGCEGAAGSSLVHADWASAQPAGEAGVSQPSPTLPAQPYEPSRSRTSSQHSGGAVSVHYEQGDSHGPAQTSATRLPTGERLSSPSANAFSSQLEKIQEEGSPSQKTRRQSTRHNLNPPLLEVASLEEVSSEEPAGRVSACTSDRELSALPDGGEHVVVKRQSSNSSERPSTWHPSLPHSSSQPNGDGTISSTTSTTTASGSASANLSSEPMRVKSRSVPAPHGFGVGPVPYLHSNSSPAPAGEGEELTVQVQQRQHRRSHDTGVEYTWDPVEEEASDEVGESGGNGDDPDESKCGGSGSLTLTPGQPGTASTTLERSDDLSDMPDYPSLLALAEQRQRPALERSLSAQQRDRNRLSNPDLVAGDGSPKVEHSNSKRRRSFSIVNKKPKHSNWASKFRALIKKHKSVKPHEHEHNQHEQEERKSFSRSDSAEQASSEHSSIGGAAAAGTSTLQDKKKRHSTSAYEQALAFAAQHQHEQHRRTRTGSRSEELHASAAQGRSGGNSNAARQLNPVYSAGRAPLLTNSPAQQYQQQQHLLAASHQHPQHQHSAPGPEFYGKSGSGTALPAVVAMHRRNAERPHSEFFAHQRSADSAAGMAEERRMLLDDDSLNEPPEKAISWFVGSSSHPITAESTEGDAVPTPPATHFVRHSEHAPIISSSGHRAPVAQHILHAQQQQQQPRARPQATVSGNGKSGAAQPAASSNRGLLSSVSDEFVLVGGYGSFSAAGEEQLSQLQPFTQHQHMGPQPQFTVPTRSVSRELLERVTSSSVPFSEQAQRAASSESLASYATCLGVLPQASNSATQSFTSPQF